jgi:hypothetical protein
LLPSSLGVLSGFRAAFCAARLLLPAETVLGRGQIFIVMITLPIFAAFVASIQQVVGTHNLVPAIILILVSELWVFLSTGVTLNPSSTGKQLEKEESKRAFLHHSCLLVSMMTAFFYFSGAETKILKYVNIEELFSPFALLVAVAESLSRATLTRVVSSDWVLVGLVRQRSDAVNQCEQRKKVLPLLPSFLSSLPSFFPSLVFPSFMLRYHSFCPFFSTLPSFHLFAAVRFRSI